MQRYVVGLGLLAALSASTFAQQAPAHATPDALPPLTPPVLGTPATWNVDVTTTGNDVHWTSPTTVDPGRARR